MHALSANPTLLTASTLWSKAMEGDAEFVQAALPTFDTTKCSALAKLCQAPDSLGQMIMAPSDPVESGKIFSLLKQICKHVGQDFGPLQAQRGMFRMSSLPQLDFILSNVEGEERPKYHGLWKQRGSTAASFDYLHKYLGTQSMPSDHLSFIIQHSNYLALEHMIDSGKYFPHIFTFAQVKEASQVTNQPRILASIMYIASFYGASSCDVHVLKALYRAFSKQGCKCEFPTGFDIWNEEHVMAFAKGPFSQWLNSAYYRIIKEIMGEDEEMKETLVKLGILSIDNI
jgi:hypothetical protein